MRSQFFFALIVICSVTCFAQKVHLPDYFPLHEGGKWIFLDEFGGYDTATMHLNVPFANEKAISISFSENEKQFFKADSSGLRMLGQTIPIGTFSFDTPLGIGSLEASVGEGASTWNWEVTHIPSGSHMSWGHTSGLLDRIETNMTVLDSTYDSVLVIDVRCGGYDREYFIAKGIGFVKMAAKGSPFFIKRELVKFIPGNIPIKQQFWQNTHNTRKIRILSNFNREICNLTIPAYSNKVHIKLLTPNGKVIINDKFRNNENITIDAYKMSTGNYILWARDGSTCMTRLFSIVH